MRPIGVIQLGTSLKATKCVPRETFCCGYPLFCHEPPSRFHCAPALTAPGGVMVTLAIVSVLDTAYPNKDTGGVFLIGLGLTFALLALLPRLHMRWAYIPALVLFVIGSISLAGEFSAANYVWKASASTARASIIRSCATFRYIRWPERFSRAPRSLN